MAAAGRRRRARGRRRRPVAVLCRWLGYLAAALFALCTLGLLYVRFLPPPITAVQLQRCIESTLAPTKGAAHYAFVPLSRISDHLEHAAVAAEDARFYEHHGIDIDGLKRALEDNWRRGRLWRGGSTITQQLVKNLFLTTYIPTFRKVFEIPLAGLAELILSKQRILELYLNVIEWGPQVYGAEAAARYHYGISAARLTRDQSARLAACLPAPRSRTPQGVDRFAAGILRRMAAMGW